MKTALAHLVRRAFLAAFVATGVLPSFSAQSSPPAEAPPLRIAAPPASPAGTVKQRVGFTDIDYDHGLDLTKARAWIEGATKGEKPQFFMLHGKAKILARLGDKAGATTAARQSMAAAQGPAQAEYKRLNEALIASLK